jgi:hypothetical protein
VSIRRLATLCTALVTLPMAGAFEARAADNNPIYDANCALCHQVGGTGLVGQFPRLAGRLGPIASDPEARRYLIATVLSGLAGRIVVDGTSLSGLMPGFSAMSDEDVASVLNYVVELSDAKGKGPSRFSRDEVATARTVGQLSPFDVLELRKALASRGQMPE